MDDDKSLRILVVDDEPRIVRTLYRLLKPFYETFQAESGEMALEIIRSQCIHVIISDQRMPQMTGSELLAKVKLISPNTSRILLTGYSDLSAVIESVNQGEIFRYITKPWNNDELLSTVKHASEISQSLFRINKPGPKTAQDLSPKDKSASRTKKDILVLDNENQLAQSIKIVLDDRVECSVAESLEAASAIMIEKDISLILMNISLDNKEALAFIKLAKTVKPDILCLVVADSADITHITSLINQGQIYRFITKPIKAGQLKMFMISALRYYKQLTDNPELLARHAVENITDEEEQKIVTNLSKSWSSIRKAFKRLVT